MSNPEPGEVRPHDFIRWMDEVILLLAEEIPVERRVNGVSTFPAAEMAARVIAASVPYIAPAAPEEAP